jgi:anti-sigma factor RsiW
MRILKMSEFPNVSPGSPDQAETKRQAFERFELLSAYIDGEVTPQERQQVQAWLDSDPKFKQAYLNLLRLQQDFVRVPVPTPSISADQLAQRVHQKLEKENRFRRLWLWGGFVATAILVGALSNLLNNPTPLSSWQQAKIELESDPLVVALNEPVIELPTEVH